MEEGKTYRYVSLLGNSLGLGTVWFKTINESKEYFYTDSEGNTASTFISPYSWVEEVD